MTLQVMSLNIQTKKRFVGVVRQADPITTTKISEHVLQKQIFGEALAPAHNDGSTCSGIY